MIRFLLRKLLLILLLLAVVAWVKQATTNVSKTVGSWVSGTRDVRIVEAFSEMVNSLSQGKGVVGAVEVFSETLQN